MGKLLLIVLAAIAAFMLLGVVISALHFIFWVAVVALIVVVGLRLTGKRTLGQLSVFDFVLLLIISNAVQNAMVGPDTSLAGGLVAAGVLMSWHWVIDQVRLRSRGLARLIAGDPVTEAERAGWSR